MEKVKKASFRFMNYIICDASIHISDTKLNDHINFSFEPKGMIDKKQNVFQLTLNTLVEDRNKSFSVDITAIANFKYELADDGSIPENYFYHNAPAILFPYIRAYIANLSALSGIQTILLPTVNMSGLAGELKENTSVSD